MMRIADGSELYCFEVVVSYCCDIPEAKDTSSIINVLLVRRQCVRSLVSLDDVEGLQTVRYCTMQSSESAQELFRKCMKDFVRMTIVQGEGLMANGENGERHPSSAFRR